MNALVISVHPDDETLGWGGTILKHRAVGGHVFWLIVTQPKEPQYPASLIERSVVEVERVAEAYGVEKCVQLGSPQLNSTLFPTGNSSKECGM